MPVPKLILENKQSHCTPPPPFAGVHKVINQFKTVTKTYPYSVDTAGRVVGLVDSSNFKSFEWIPGRFLILISGGQGNSGRTTHVSGRLRMVSSRLRLPLSPTSAFLPGPSSSLGLSPKLDEPRTACSPTGGLEVEVASLARRKRGSDGGALVLQTDVNSSIDRYRAALCFMILTLFVVCVSASGHLPVITL